MWYNNQFHIHKQQHGGEKKSQKSNNSTKHKTHNYYTTKQL